MTVALRSLARFRAGEPVAAEARCELCGGPLGDRHRHVVEPGERGVLCACRACAILFERSEAGARYRTVPDRIARDPAFALTSDTLGIPVGIAICVRDSQRGAVISYPGPAGMTEAELDPHVWDAIAAATPLAAQLEPDVEALLVHGRRGERSLACYLLPISMVYGLVGRLRGTWEGFSGGPRAEAELASFFAELGGHP
jgi:hypothetical protein